MSNKIYRNLDDMINDNKGKSKEALQELNKSIIERQKERKQKLMKSIIFIVGVFFLFKIFIGETNLNLPIYYNHRLYEVTLNKKLISVCVDEYRKSPIIPFMINNNYVGLHCFHQDDEGMKTRIFNKGDKIHITINSFECFNPINNGKTSCYQKKNPIKKETNDTKYSLLIKRVKREGTVMYDGDFINNITDYFLEKGTYDVNMIAKHGNVKSVIFFSIKIVD